MFGGRFIAFLLVHVVAATLVVGCESFDAGSTPPGAPPATGDAGAGDAQPPQRPPGGGTESRCASIPTGAFCDDFDQPRQLTPHWFDARPNATINSETSFAGTSSLLVTVPAGSANNPQFVAQAAPRRQKLHVEARVWYETLPTGTIDLLMVTLENPSNGLSVYEIDISRLANKPFGIEENKGAVGTSHFEMQSLTFGKWDLIELTIDLEARTATFQVNRGPVYEKTNLTPPDSFGQFMVKLGFPYAQNVSDGRVRFDDVVIYSE